MANPSHDVFCNTEYRHHVQFQRIFEEQYDPLLLETGHSFSIPERL